MPSRHIKPRCYVNILWRRCISLGRQYNAELAWFFRDLSPMLGNFHLTKALLRCAGRYLTGNGVDHALIEGEVFEKKVLVSVLSGGHYVRSLQDMFIVCEAFHSIAWKAFWRAKQHDPSLVQHLHNLRILLLYEKGTNVKFEFTLSKTKKLKEEFESFLKECEVKSELCQYLSVFQDMFRKVKNLIVADRDGNWYLHVYSVQSSMQVFQGFNAIKYLPFNSFYLEKNKYCSTHMLPCMRDLFRAFLLWEMATCRLLISSRRFEIRAKY